MAVTIGQVQRYCMTCQGTHTHRALQGDGCVAYVCINCEHGNREEHERKKHHVVASKTIFHLRPPRHA